MADMAVVDTASAEAATFMVLTPVDFMDAVPTSLAVAIGADTKGTGEHMGAMVATADMVAIVDTAERTDRAKMTTTDVRRDILFHSYYLNTKRLPNRAFFHACPCSNATRTFIFNGLKTDSLSI